MDTPHWPQAIGVVKPTVSSSGSLLERKAVRPNQKDLQALNCPRCNSTNTKFCYYNNYSLSQPRYFCKTCRRYWTQGGTLRNIPVGGSSRKKKRPTTTTTPSSSSAAAAESLSRKLDIAPQRFSQEKSNMHAGQDLNLAYGQTEFQDYKGMPKFVQVPFTITENNSTNIQQQNSSVSGISRGFSSLMMMAGSDAHAFCSSGFSMQEFQPSLQESASRMLFPVEDLKAMTSMKDFEQNRGQGDSNGYWSGMLSGGGTW